MIDRDKGWNRLLVIVLDALFPNGMLPAEFNALTLAAVSLGREIGSQAQVIPARVEPLPPAAKAPKTVTSAPPAVILTQGRKCVVCSAPIAPEKRASTKFCSHACCIRDSRRRKAAAASPAKETHISAPPAAAARASQDPPRVCMRCRASIQDRNPRSAFCSTSCRVKDWRRRTERYAKPAKKAAAAPQPAQGKAKPPQPEILAQPPRQAAQPQKKTTAMMRCKTCSALVFKHQLAAHLAELHGHFPATPRLMFVEVEG